MKEKLTVAECCFDEETDSSKDPSMVTDDPLAKCERKDVDN